MSNARYSDEYMQSVYDRITDLEKENDNLRVAMKSMASAVTVKDLNNTIDALARCTKVDTKVKTDLLAQIHRLEDTLVTSTLADAARTNASKDKLEETQTELVNTLHREDRLLKDLASANKARDEYCEGNRNLVQEYDVVVEALRACKVDKEHMQNTIRDLDRVKDDTWVYVAKLRKTNAALEDTIRKLETEQYEHSWHAAAAAIQESGDVTTLEKDRAALDTLNRMLLKNNKVLRARLNNLEGPGYADAVKQIQAGYKYISDNYKGE